MKKWSVLKTYPALLQELKQCGAFLWNKPLLRFSKFSCLTHRQIPSRQIPSVEWIYNVESPLISRFPTNRYNNKSNKFPGIPLNVCLPDEFLGFLSFVFEHTPQFQEIKKYPGSLRGADGPSLRCVFANQIEPYRNDWHVDGHAVNVMIPLTHFTRENGGTRLKLKDEERERESEEVVFESPPLQNALVYAGDILHRQGGNFTNQDRCGLIFNIDPAVFMAKEALAKVWTHVH